MQDLIVRNGSTWSYTIIGIPTEADAELSKQVCPFPPAHQPPTNGG